MLLSLPFLAPIILTSSLLIEGKLLKLDLVSQVDAVPPQPGADRIVTLVPLGVYWKPKIYHLADIIALDTLQSEIILGAGSYNPDASPTYVPEMASALVERIIYDAFYTAYLTASTKGRETLEFGDREVRGVEILLNPNPLAGPMYPTLGIGYQSGVEFGAPTFIQALHDQGQIEGKLISTAYSYSPGTTDGGTLYLGAINFTYVHGHFTNYSFIRDDSRDGLMSLPVGENGRVILATSSPMNLVPEAYYVQFVEGILGSGNYSNTTAEELTYALFDCALRQGMPAIEYPTGSGIWLGPNQYVIPSASLCMSSFAFTGPDHRFYNEYTLGSFSALNDIVAVIDYERNTYGRATLAMPPS